nr:TlpA disulfide reductase family protein [Pedobacter sp. N36a]
MASLCLFFKADAQSQITDIKPLNIGDTIPEAVWNVPLQVVNHPTGKKTITLNDYRGKLIILDFWATYCSPCIRSLNELDSLQKVFDKEIKVLPVMVYDLEKNALPFIKKKNWTWPSVVNDTTLNKIVFSKYLLGFGNVWIYDGRLWAIPRPKEINSGNISKVLARQRTEMENLKARSQ